MRSTALMTIFAIGGLAAGATSAHSQCGGGGGYYRGGGHGGGHTFTQGYGGCCGMMMGGMPMPATQAPAASMPGMNMNGPAAPAATTAPAATAAAASYHCPMHPNVVASFAAKCPYCGMALTKK